MTHIMEVGQITQEHKSG